MNNKLSERLNSFPKDYQLSQETQLKIESVLQEEIEKMEKQAKWKGFKGFIKKLTIPVSGIAVIAIISLLLLTSENFQLFQTGVNEITGNSGTVINSDKDYKKMTELTTIWAYALKTRDGKPRYAMMSEKAKEKFKHEQIIRGGEDWNYNIGYSSPWVVDFEIEIDGMTATITYFTQTSEPAYYSTEEQLTFVKEDGKLLVDNYQYIFEDKLIESNGINNKDQNNEKEYTEFRQVAWESLSKNEKDTVIGDWQKAHVIEVTPADVPQHIKLEKNQKVVKVVFNTEQDSLLGPIGLYIDRSSKEMIGPDIRK
ncbi:hypothetical protein P9265_19620 [Schinkia azotoformans]|uniref:hypothetical protein n=1 Tax=Schinkia azotoformans TaxID=1454 RepID=UPI002E24A245|nr:hypothetical protein [Schinkia azotoformans]